MTEPNDLHDDIEKSNILIVDDIVENLKIIGSLLTDNGYHVIPATNGNQALGLSKSRIPDLILLDIQMPEMDGFEVCRKLKDDEQTKDIPIIFLTAKNEVEDIIMGFNLGACDYIEKPFKVEEVLIRIKNQLEIKKSRDIIKNQNIQLSELNSTKDKFFSIIAHDLKNPLGSFRDLTNLLSDNFDGLPKAEKDELLMMIKDSANLLYSLLENLLDWSRSQRGVITFNPVEADISYIVGLNISLLKVAAANKKITIENNLLTSYNAYFDVPMITTVVRNLLSNAIKFTPIEGKISFSANIIKDFGNLGNDFIEISITDSGIGISEENIQKLFRIDISHSTTGTSNETGTGLGLILCKEFVEKNKGTINVTSTLGVGSTFSFTLPLISNLQNY